ALLDGPIPFGGFVEAMEERLGRIPRYRERPVRPLLDLGWPRWEGDPAFDVRRHLRHVALPPPAGGRQLPELLHSLFPPPLRRGAPPAPPRLENFSDRRRGGGSFRHPLQGAPQHDRGGEGGAPPGGEGGPRAARPAAVEPARHTVPHVARKPPAGGARRRGP